MAARAGKLRPLERALALLDQLLTRAVLIEYGDDVLGAARHVGYNESDARIKFSRMPLDLGDDRARLRPAFTLIGKVRFKLNPTYLIPGPNI